MKWTWIAGMISNQPSRSLCRTVDIDAYAPEPYAHVYRCNNGTWAATWDDGQLIGYFDHKGEAMDAAFDVVAS